MKNVGKMILNILCITLLVQPMVSGATETEDIRFERGFQTAETDLELKGVGLLRYLGFIKAYAGAFYLEEGIPIDDALADKAKRIEVEYFKPFKGKDFGPATVKMMEKNVSRETIERIRDQIDYHNSLYEDVEPGDRYALTYVPGKGTELALNGEPKGVVEGAEFASALFSIWIGKKPIDKSFKRQIMGL